MLKRRFFSILLCSACFFCHIQTGFSQSFLEPIPFNRATDLNPRVYQSNDTIWIFSGICKTLRITMLTGADALPYLGMSSVQPKKAPGLVIHGNVQYDFSYRSLVDTPFAQKDFAQHSIQTTMDILIRDQYPLRVTLSTRRSNSSYFENITDINVQFNRSDLLNTVKNRLRERVNDFATVDELSALERKYMQKIGELGQIRNWLNNPARMQEIIEAKEAAASRAVSERLSTVTNRPDIRSIAGAQLDSIQETNKKELQAGQDVKAMSLYDRKKEELDSVADEIKKIQQQIGDVKKSIQDSIARVKQEISRLKDPSEIRDFIRKNNLDPKELPSGWGILSAIHTVGIGRSWVDYSELTVKNISLTGLNIEMNPSKLYFAFAAGRVNYRFRDFVVKNNNQSKQSLVMVRAGLGQKEGNNLILTYYDGKRNRFNSYGNSTAATNLERVVGLSLESRVQLDPNNFLVFEVARSSFTDRFSPVPGEPQLLKKVFNLKNRSNEAYNVRVSSYWPKSDTRINGYYRNMGRHFQSFNLLPVDINQEAYQVKVEQAFWKRKLLVEVGIRKNDFNNLYINPASASKTLFKSIQASLRIKKWPFISVGYFPSSQLTVVDNNVIVENQYNTLNLLVSHNYNAGGINMNSNAVFLRFFNKGTDTGFIYYNASSLILNHYIFLKGLQLQSGVTLTNQENVRLIVWEQSGSLQVRHWLTLNGSGKYNRLNGEKTMWGGSAGIGVIIKHVGTIQASYDKSYLPGTQRDLLPVDMGRVTYYRVF